MVQKEMLVESPIVSGNHLLAEISHPVLFYLAIYRSVGMRRASEKSFVFLNHATHGLQD